MIAEIEIRKELVSLLNNEIDLDTFEDWLALKSWDMHVDSAGAAQKLASAIELRLAEYSGGHCDYESLRAELVPYATQVDVVVPFSHSPVIVLSSSSRSITPLGLPEAWSWADRGQTWGQPADTTHEMGYV